MIEGPQELGPNNFVTVATLVSVVIAAIAGTAAWYSIKRDVSDLKRGILPRHTFRLWIAEARDRTKLDLPKLHEIEDSDEVEGT